MKVLFTHSYFLKKDPKQLKAATPYPPLATLYAAAYIRERGHQVFLADLQFGDPAELQNHIKHLRPDALVIYDDGFNYLTKMCLTNMRDCAFTMQQMAKAAGIKVIVSSSDASDHQASYLANGADYIVIGEAEITLAELIAAIEEKRDNIKEIEGIVFSENNAVSKTAPRAVMKQLDDLPLPAWDLVDFEPYRKIWLQKHGYFSLNLVSTRGCPYKCNWCAKPIYGNRYTCHSPDRVIEHIRELSKFCHPDHFWFADDIFGLKPGWIKRFSELLAISGIKIRYKIQSRADLLGEETVKYLAASGCVEVWMGAESGSQKILDLMEKGTTLSQIKESTLLLKTAGVRPCFFLQFGYSGETIHDITETIRLLDELQPHDIGISVSYPLPGTKFYENVKSELVSKQNWTDSDDLSLMFSSTYPPDFYRALQRFVHYRFRSKQLAGNLRQRKDLTRLPFLPYYYFRQAGYKRKLVAHEPLTASY